MEHSVKDRTFKILFAGDNYAEQLLIKMALDKIIHNELFSVNNTKETIDFLRRSGKPDRTPGPDLIIVDLDDDLSCLKSLSLEIKANPVFRSIPLVVLTACRDRNLIKSFCPVADTIISKPSDICQFINTIHCLWNLRFSKNN